jgi:hypothetical protein
LATSDSEKHGKVFLSSFAQKPFPKTLPDVHKEEEWHRCALRRCSLALSLFGGLGPVIQVVQ